jgi:hypothetical protein
MQIAKLSALDKFLYLHNRRAIDEGMAGEKNALLGRRQGYQLVGKLRGVGQRFLNENVLAR